MEVDHARGDTSRRMEAAKSARSSGCDSAWASRARVTSASAARRSSATERSPARVSTRSSALRPDSANASGVSESDPELPT